VKNPYLPALILLFVVAACTPTPTPTVPPAPPTNTPQIYATVIVSRPTRTEAPTWTPAPTRTERPTNTPAPTRTPRPTNTRIPTLTPVGGQVGVLTEDGQITVLLTAAEVNRALSAERENYYFGAEMNTAGGAKFEDRRMTVDINFNNFTTTGVPGVFSLTLRAFNGELVVDLINFESRTSTAITPTQAGLARELIRRAFVDRAIPDAIRLVQPFLATATVRTVRIGPEGVIVTAQITLATPTPTPSASPEALPSVTLTPSQTFTPLPTTTPIGGVQPTFTPTPTPALRN